ncbi:unnamed protein product [Miscanthus lutarioriparius]|uniref:Uncharacterized protein n=1 Tax=Miscanthus lutarioriparius TaxID=422564 RepID=A0A811RTQ3_9POAL|nr:unnamed protein product [Miscanthus lutarioriparius]
MCKQGQAILGWWWLVASVPRRPTAGHPPSMNAKVKTGAAWWRRWRSCPPLSVGEAAGTDRFSGIAGEGGGSEAGEKCGNGGNGTAGREEGPRRLPDPDPSDRLYIAYNREQEESNHSSTEAYPMPLFELPNGWAVQPQHRQQLKIRSERHQSLHTLS